MVKISTDGKFTVTILNIINDNNKIVILRHITKCNALRVRPTESETSVNHLTKVTFWITT